MRLPAPATLGHIARLINAHIHIGDPELPVTGLNELHKVTPGDLSFVDHPKYYDKVLHSAATTILANAPLTPPEGKAVLVSDDPWRDYNALVQHFHPMRPLHTGQYAKGEGTTVPASCFIAPGVVLGHNVTLGERVQLGPNVVVMDDTIIGNDVIIGPNTTIGGDGFYFKRRPEGYDKLLSAGRVVIHDRVEIGCNCTIDKGVSGDTILGEGCKLDNLIHLGHGVVLGKNVLMAAGSVVGGKSHLEDNVTIWGNCGIQKDVVVGAGSVLQASSTITKSMPAGGTYVGFPARDSATVNREWAYLAMSARNHRKGQ